MTRFRVLARLLLPLVVLLCGWANAESAEEPPPVLAVDDVMESDPALVEPAPVLRFPPEVTALWIKSLDHPEADLRRQIVHSIAKAHRLGIPGMTESVPKLIALLQEDGLHPTVRHAIVAALATLDAQSAAPDVLAEVTASGGSIAQVGEPALARWRHEPAYAMWKQRIAEQGPDVRALRLAIRCLGEVRDASSAEALAELVDNPQAHVTVRIEAAQALASISRSGLEPQARRLAADKTDRAVNERLLAATLLQHHSGTATEELLVELGRDSEPTVAGRALERLVVIAPEQVLPLADELVTKADAKLRRIAAQALVKVPSPETVAVLGTLLDDANPGNRQYVCSSLFVLARQEELRPAVIDAGVEALAGEAWRGLEQATLLLSHLDHKPAAARLVELLDHSRGEVLVTAAWGLRKLAVPETFPAMLEKATREHERIAAGDFNVLTHASIDRQVAQLFQCFGETAFLPAEDLMRTHIPKRAGVGNISRRAAIWSLGHLHAGQPDEELTAAFRARLRDLNPFDPEDDGVRRYAAIGLGRMMAKSTVGDLEGRFNDVTEVVLAARWAFEQLTGQTLPPLPPPRASYSNWSLVPLTN